MSKVKIKIKYKHWWHKFYPKNVRLRKNAEKILNMPEIVKCTEELTSKALLHEMKYGKKLSQKQMESMVERYIRRNL